MVVAKQQVTQKRYVLANPLKRGFSRRSVSANIAEMRRAGVPQNQAVAAAYDMAREVWRKRNGRKTYPPHLKAQPAATTKNRRKVRKNIKFKQGPGKVGARGTHGGVVEHTAKPGYIIETQKGHGGTVKIKPDKRGTIKRNPTPTRSRKFQKAVKLYKAFTGAEPKFVDEYMVTVPEVALEVGKVTGILYKARVDGKLQEFLHEFSGRSRPTLGASAEGDQLVLLGGDYRFTEQGIVDGTASFRR